MTNTPTLFTRTLLVMTSAVVPLLLGCDPDDEGVFAEGEDPVENRCSQITFNTNLVAGTDALHHYFTNSSGGTVVTWNQAMQTMSGKYTRFISTNSTCPYNGQNYPIVEWYATPTGDLIFWLDIGNEWPHQLAASQVVNCKLGMEIADNVNFTVNKKTGTLKIIAQESQSHNGINGATGSRYRYKMGLDSNLKASNAPVISGDVCVQWCTNCAVATCEEWQAGTERYSMCVSEGTEDPYDYWLGVRTGWWMGSNLSFSSSANTAAFACHSSIPGKPPKWRVPNSTSDSSLTFTAAEAAAIGMRFNGEVTTNLGNSIVIRTVDATWPGYARWNTGNANPVGYYKEGVYKALLPFGIGWGYTMCRGDSASYGYYSINRNAGFPGNTAYSEDWDDVAGAGSLTNCATYLAGTGARTFITFAKCHNTTGLPGGQVCP